MPAPTRAAGQGEPKPATCCHYQPGDGPGYHALKRAAAGSTQGRGALGWLVPRIGDARGFAWGRQLLALLWGVGGSPDLQTLQMFFERRAAGQGGSWGGCEADLYTQTSSRAALRTCQGRCVGSTEQVVKCRRGRPAVAAPA
jgi:hypothetical protein